MPKKLVAAVGEYTNQQGETKKRWQNVGVIMDSNDGGQYVLIDHNVSLAGIMQSQNVMAMKKNEQLRDRVMLSVFDDDNNQQGGGYQQPQQQPPQQGGYQQQSPQQAPPQQTQPQQHYQNGPNHSGYQQPGQQPGK